MGMQEFFHLDRIDILAAGDEHILFAVDHIEKAVRILPHHIASGEPAILQRIGGRLRILPVSRGGHRPFQLQFTGLVYIRFLPGIIDDPDIDIKIGHPDRADLADSVILVQAGDVRPHLGQPVPLTDRHALAVPGFDQRQRHRLAAHDEIAQRIQPGRSKSWIGGHQLQHRRYPHEEGQLL